MVRFMVRLLFFKVALFLPDPNASISRNLTIHHHDDAAQKAQMLLLYQDTC